MTGVQTCALPILFGGKITTFRKLAEEAVDKLGEALQSPARSKTWTEGAPLPGGDIANADFAVFLASFKQRNRWLPGELAHRYARAYGTRAQKLLGDASSLADLGEALAPDLYEAELRYMRDNEWATCADDVLWRRSKLGLHLEPGSLDDVIRRIDGWFASSKPEAEPRAESSASATSSTPARTVV